MSIKTIAIIGCGAAATTFFRSYIDECINNNIKGINILIFEYSKELGTGLAYQDDMDALLINRPAQSMSANPADKDEFIKWLQKCRLLSSESVLNQQPLYVSRKVFGLYLNEIFEKTIIKASLQRIDTRVIYEKATKILGNHTFIIETLSNKAFLADAVILCTGNNQPNDIYSLDNTSQYINSPYPVKKMLANINPGASVGILGNSLTAIDITKALQTMDFVGTIKMFSRYYVIPRVRGAIHSHTPRFLTPTTINKLINKKQNISLRDILRLFRKEMIFYNLSWQFLFREDDKNMYFSKLLENDLKAAFQPLPWQSIIPSINPVAERLWHHLKISEKEIFIKHYNRMWLNHRSSIPPNNAQSLINLANKNQLFMYSGIKNVSYDDKMRKYNIYLHDGSTHICDWIINATGPSKFVGPKDGLLYELIKHGTANANPLGGLNIDFHSAGLINDQGLVNPRIRLIGHNSIGVYQYTSSLELISKKSVQISKSFVSFMLETAHDQKSISISTSTDQLGHSSKNFY